MKSLLFLLLTAFAVIYFFFSNEAVHFWESVLQGENIITLENNTSESNIEVTELMSNGIHSYIGKNSIDILDELGQPDRIDPTSYDYSWWIYKSNSTYFQLAINNGVVVSSFGFGENMNAAPFYLGEGRDKIEQTVIFNKEVSLTHNGNSYLFTLNNEDMQMRPLVAIENGWAQLYFDTFTNTLSSVRYLNTETLLLHRPYTLKYRGALIEPRNVIRQQWKAIEEANEKQVLDITNIIRKSFNVATLQWHEKVATVAFKHSQDMSENNYFAHESPTKGDLGDRLKAENITFSFAGENIASNYVDALASVEGWLNSEGHRKALLSDKYTHLGVGVYEKYYTQNFIKE